MKKFKLASLLLLFIAARPLVAFETGSWIDYIGNADLFHKYGKNMTSISAFGYGFDADNNMVPLQPWVDPLIDDLMKSRVPGQPVLISITNFIYSRPSSEWQPRLKDMLSNPAKRAKVIQQVVALSQRADGIDVDYEYGDVAIRPYFSQFVKELRAALPAGKILSVITMAQVSDSGQYDLAAIQANADMVRILTYYWVWMDHPGPPTPADILDNQCKFSLTKVPKEKLHFVLTQGGVDFAPHQHPSAMFFSWAMEIIRARGITPVRDGAYLKFNYVQTDGVLHTVWYTDQITLQTNINVVLKNGIDKVDLWKLGQGDPNMWSWLTGVITNPNLSGLAPNAIITTSPHVQQAKAVSQSGQVTPAALANTGAMPPAIYGIPLTGNARLVYCLYVNILGRIPDLGGLQAWTNAFKTNTFPTIANGVVNSAEFQNFGTSFKRNTFAIPALIDYYLHRAATATDLAAYADMTPMEITNAITKGTSNPPTPAAIINVSANVRQAMQSSQNGQITGAAFANTGPIPTSLYGIPLTGDARRTYCLYVNMLGRVPEVTGFQAWINTFKAGYTFSDIANGFLNSSEFQNFGTVFRRNTFAIPALVVYYLNRSATAADFTTYAGMTPTQIADALRTIKPVNPNAIEMSSWLTYPIRQEQTLDQYGKNFSSISVFAYHFDVNGNLIPATPWVDTTLNNLMSRRVPGRPVYITIVNDVAANPPQQHNGQFILGILSDPTKRANHIRQLVALSARADGIEIDYESLLATTKPHFTKFIQELRAALPPGKKLSADCQPKTVDVDGPRGQAIDWKALHPYLDQVKVMAYYYSFGGSVPGPSVPLDKLSEVTSLAISQVPAAKLHVVLTQFGWDWPNGGTGKFISYADAIQTAQARQATPFRDPASQYLRVNYTDGTTPRQIWIADNATFQAQINALRAKGVKKIDMWQLGVGDPNFWTWASNNTVNPDAPGSLIAGTDETAQAQAIIDLSEHRVYPNPWKANQHGGAPITFDRLPSDATIKLYTLSAQWVTTLSAGPGTVSWELDNDSGQGVASGDYLYLITDPNGHKAHGRLAIIR